MVLKVVLLERLTPMTLTPRTLKSHIRSICHRCTAGVQGINDYMVDIDEVVKLAISTQSILAS